MNIFQDLSLNTLFDTTSIDLSSNDLNAAGYIYFRQLLERNYLSNMLLQNQSVNNIINGSLNDENKFKNVISDDGKKCLKTIQYRKNVCKNEYCPITQEKFKTRQSVTILPCKHGYTPESIKEWLEKQNAECPVCRVKLDSKEIKNEDYEDVFNIQESRNALLESLNMVQQINNPYGRNININLSHPYGRNQLNNVIPHSYINMSEEEAINQAILNSMCDISNND